MSTWAVIGSVPPGNASALRPCSQALRAQTSEEMQCTKGQRNPARSVDTLISEFIVRLLIKIPQHSISVPSADLLQLDAAPLYDAIHKPQSNGKFQSVAPPSPSAFSPASPPEPPCPPRWMKLFRLDTICTSRLHLFHGPIL